MKENNDYIVLKTNTNFLSASLFFILQNLVTLILYPFIMILFAEKGWIIPFLIVCGSAISKLYFIYRFVISLNTKYTITKDNLVIKQPYNTRIYEIDRIEDVFSIATRHYIKYEDETLPLGFIKDGSDFIETIKNA